jgi:Mn-dependent DtxR family transcriptional regulator
MTGPTFLTIREIAFLRLLPVNVICQKMRGARIWHLCRDLNITPFEVSQIVRGLKKKGIMVMAGYTDDYEYFLTREDARALAPLLED